MSGTRSADFDTTISSPNQPAAVSPTQDDDFITLSYFNANASSGAAGINSINHIGNSDFEVNVNGYSAFADAPGVSPVDGTGGAPNVTFTQDPTPSNLIRGSAVGKLSKDASDRQGEGVSADFEIDIQDQGNDLEIFFEFKSTGAFAAADVEIFIYDKTNAALIPVDNASLAGTSGTFASKFEAAANSVDYRLIFFIPTTNAGSWDFLIDSITVTPGSLSVTKVIDNRTANYTIPTTEMAANRIFTNSGSAGNITFTLTDGAPIGSEIEFMQRESGNNINVLASGSELVDVVENSISGAEEVRTDSDGASMRLIKVSATQWTTIFDEGNWVQVFDTQVYIPSGNTVDGTNTSASVNESYVFDSWQTLNASGSFDSVSQAAVGGVFSQQKVYLIFGVDGGGQKNKVQIYDIGGNSWSDGVATDTARAGGAGVAVGTIVYIYGGGGIINNLDGYNTVGDSFTGLAAPNDTHADGENICDSDGTNFFAYQPRDGAAGRIARYNVGANTWSNLSETLPAEKQNGKGIVDDANARAAHAGGRIGGTNQSSIFTHNITGASTATSGATLALAANAINGGLIGTNGYFVGGENGGTVIANNNEYSFTGDSVAARTAKTTAVQHASGDAI